MSGEAVEQRSARLLVVDDVPVLSIPVRRLPEAIGVGRETLRRHIKSGALPVFYLGRVPLVKTADVLAWLDERPSAPEREDGGEA